MLHDETSEPRSPLKNPLFYTSAAVLIALLAVLWIFFSRWQENRSIERHAAEKRVEEDRKSLARMGGAALEIQNFYATPPAIKKGETVQLCYGVANAKTVKLEPQSNPVWPSYARCVDVSPVSDTTYTLTAQDAAGNTKTQTVEVKVH